jgi:hypothetical protein
VLRVGSVGVGGDGPLPGTPAGSSGGRDAEAGVVELSLLTLLVSEPPDVVPESPPDPLVAVDAVPALTEVSEPDPEVASGEEPVGVVDASVALADASLGVVTEPETVRLPDPESAVAVVTDDASTVVAEGAVAAGASDPEAVIGDEPPPLELLTSLGAPLDESASRRPLGESVETIKGMLASDASG